jgi:putative tricarboxylic transport membrane protein
VSTPIGGERLRHNDRLAAVALLLLAAWVAWLCCSLPLGSLARPGPAAWPLALAVLLALLAVTLFFGGRVRRSATVGPSEARRAIALLLAGGFAAAALETLGYPLTMLAVLLFLIGVVERRPILLTLAVSSGLAFGTHLAFARLLKVPLPAGLLGL